MQRLHVATLNLRNIADRWEERLPILLADFAALQPDVIGLQEVVYAVQQDRILGSAGAGHYRAFRGWAGRPEYGNAMLVRESLEASGPDRLELGRNRSALRVSIRLPDGPLVAVTVTHLHHSVDGAAVRDEQAGELLGWLDDGPWTDASVVVGDFNADPAEPAYARMSAAGFRSAYREVTGAEPEVTWPSGIQAPGMDTEGDPGCLDYVWVRGPLRAVSARLVFDRPAIDDPTLFPSDHFGIAAELEVDGDG